MLYLVARESFGFETIFDALALGRGGVGRNRDTLIDDPAIPEIPALLAVGWSEADPISARQLAAFLGRPEQPATEGSIFPSVLVDENITSFADFVDYGYAIYELAPGGDLIRLGADGEPLFERTIPEVSNRFLPEGIDDAPLSETMIGPFSIVAFDNFGLESLNDINGASIPLIPGSAIESAVNALYSDLGFSYTAVIVFDQRIAFAAFLTGEADLLIYPTRLIDGSLLEASYQVIGFDGRVSDVGSGMPESPGVEDPIDPPSTPLPPPTNNDDVFDFDILSGVRGASFTQVMTGPFSFIAEQQLGLSSLDEIDGATIAVIPGSEIEAALNTLARELNLSYEPVFVESIEQAVVSFQAGISDLFVYPTRLIDESGLSGIAGQFSLLEGTFGTSTPPVLPSVAFDTVEFATDRNNTAFDGTSGNDYLAGLRGDDRIFGGGGDDWIIGGPGLDVARYSGAQSSYSLTLGPTGTYLSDRHASGDGTDRLIDVELIEFASTAQGDPFDLRIFGGPAGLSQSELQSFVELYIAYFNRAPDAIGLNFWGTAFANGTSLDQIAALFIDQAETRLLYPETLTNDAFVLAVYANVLGRLPDDAGYNFWRATLDSATVTRDTFILEILRGAKADPQDVDVAFIQQQTIDRNYLENKTDLGIYFAVTLGMSNVSNASAVMATFGASQQQTLSTAIAAANAFHAAALDPVAGEFLMPLVGVIDNPFPQV